MHALSNSELKIVSGGNGAAVPVVTVTGSAAQVANAKAEYAAGFLAAAGGLAAGFITTGACTVVVGGALGGPVGMAGMAKPCAVLGSIVGAGVGIYLKDLGSLFLVDSYVEDLNRLNGM